MTYVGELLHWLAHCNTPLCGIADAQLHSIFSTNRSERCGETRHWHTTHQKHLTGIAESALAASSPVQRLQGGDHDLQVLTWDGASEIDTVAFSRNKEQDPSDTNDIWRQNLCCRRSPCLKWFASHMAAQTVHLILGSSGGHRS